MIVMRRPAAASLRADPEGKNGRGGGTGGLRLSGTSKIDDLEKSNNLVFITLNDEYSENNKCK